MRDESFASDEFGGANLGDSRREKRLLSMATQLLETPGGKIATVFAHLAEREAAYRFVENASIDAEQIRASAARAGFARARGEAFVYVPIDSTTLTLPTVPHDSDMGPIGNRWSSELGVHAMNGIIVSAAGVTLGAAAQIFWARERQETLSRTKAYASGKATKRISKPTNRPIAEKETSHWGTAMEQAMQAALEANFIGQLWFQLDAGADFAHLLASATLMKPWVTVRTRNPRTLFQESDLLLEHVLQSAPVGNMQVEVPLTNSRAARVATLELRYVPVLLKLKPRGDGGTIPAPLFAVSVREISNLPKHAEPIEWLLLTNKDGETLDDAIAVVKGYTMRWRIEEVHKAWKSTTKVEDSGLESVHAFSILATILFSVAIRIERLKYLARAEPHQPATIEFTDEEIVVLHGMRRVKMKTSKTFSISDAVRWVADLGGYMNPHKGPPGNIIIARGLHRLRAACVGFRLAKM